MENIINSIKGLFVTYGFRSATIIVVTILLVNLIKRPIVKHAEKMSEKTGTDKSVVTKYITFLPIVISFFMSFVWEWIVCDFRFGAIDYGELTATSFVLAAVAVATFESIKKQLEAYAAKKESKSEAKRIVPEEQIDPNKRGKL